MELKVKISKEEEERIYEQARDDVRSELTKEAVKNYIYNARSLDLISLVKDFGLHEKYEEIKNTSLKDLTRNEKFTAMLYWLIYNMVG